jgi:hypothetical protein
MLTVSTEQNRGKDRYVPLKSDLILQEMLFCINRILNVRDMLNGCTVVPSVVSITLQRGGNRNEKHETYKM